MHERQPRHRNAARREISNWYSNAIFKTKNFEHKAYYDSDTKRIEMHLISQIDHRVTVNSTLILFEAGEMIHTENSYNYTDDQLATLL